MFKLLQLKRSEDNKFEYKKKEGVHANLEKLIRYFVESITEWGDKNSESSRRSYSLQSEKYSDSGSESGSESSGWGSSSDEDDKPKKRKKVEPVKEPIK